MNVADNMMLMLQTFATQVNKGNTASQNTAIPEDGSSFRSLMEKQQSASRPQTQKPAQRPAQNQQKPMQNEQNAETPNEAPAANTDSTTVSQELVASALPQNIVIVPAAVQMTVDSAVQAAPQTTQAFGQLQQQQQGPLATVQTGETALSQTRQSQMQPEAKAEPQQIVPKAEPTVDLRAAQAKPQENIAKTPNAEQTPLTSQGNDVTVKQGEEAPAEPLFRQLEGTPVKVGDAQTLDTTAQNFEQQLAKQIDKALQNGEQKIQINLTPEHLGKLTIELTRAQDGSLRMVLFTASERATTLLSEHSSSLASLLRGNVQAPVQVEIQQQNQQQGQREDQQQQQHGHHQQQQQNRHNEQQTQDFLQQLRLGILPFESEAS